MTAMPSRREDASGTIAALFAFEAGIGGVPGAAGAWIFLKMMFGGFGGASPTAVGGLFALIVLGFIFTGFALLIFYCRRAAGHRFANESGWWRASLLYNAVLLIPALTWGSWAPVGVLWFTALCGLSWWAWQITDNRGDEDELA